MSIFLLLVVLTLRPILLMVGLGNVVSPDVHFFLQIYSPTVVFFRLGSTIEVFSLAVRSPFISFLINSMTLLYNGGLSYLLIVNFNMGFVGAAISIGISNILNFVTASTLLKYCTRTMNLKFWQYTKEETHHLSAEFWLGVSNIPLTSLSDFSRCFLILYVSSSGPSNFMATLVLFESLDKL
jgi:Na+-driven multidrug efflux pump